MKLEMVLVPAGTFIMGLPEREGDSDTFPAHPQHKVTVQGFYVGKYEVTQAQWRAVMDNNPSDFKNCDQCPVERVSWNATQEFIKKLNGMQSRYTYRLPSEAEWEYACRAGMTWDWAVSIDSMDWRNSTEAFMKTRKALDAMAWYDSNSGDKTHPVGQKQANAWGLYDMHGNVLEWCMDWYHGSYDGAPLDGSAWLSGGEQKERVLRGGSWAYSALGQRSWVRHSLEPFDTRNYMGFRLAAVER